MLTCKQVSKSLADQDYDTLSWGQKLSMKVHVTLCFVCGRYNRQMMDVYDGIRGYKAFEEKEGDFPHAPTLTGEQRERLKETIGADGA